MQQMITLAICNKFEKYDIDIDFPSNSWGITSIDKGIPVFLILCYHSFVSVVSVPKREMKINGDIYINQFQ